MIKFDAIELMVLFDSAKSSSETISGVCEYEYTRDDGMVVLFSFNEYNRDVGLSVEKDGISSLSLLLDHCRAIRVLDTVRRQFEILFDPSLDMRIFVDLKGEIVVSMNPPDLNAADRS